MLRLEHLAAQDRELIKERNEREDPQDRRRGDPVLSSHDEKHLLRVEKEEVARHDLAAEELDRAQPEELDETGTVLPVFDQRREEGSGIDDGRDEKHDPVRPRVEADRLRVEEPLDDEDVDIGDELQGQPDQEEQKTAAQKTGEQSRLDLQGNLPPGLGP